MKPNTVYLEKIKEIEKEVYDYFELSFANEEEEFEHNKSVKNKYKELFIQTDNRDSVFIRKVLLSFAKLTGCAEDLMIADEIIDFLLENNYINKEDALYFYNNSATNR